MSRRNRPKLGCSEAHDFARAASHSTTAWRALCLALLGLAGMFGQPGSASAQGYWAWAPLGVGCARAISVGPNGVPWILGCTGGNPNGTGPAWVYYLTWSNAPESFFTTYKWQYDNISAVTLYVNLNGVPYVTDLVGNVWYETGNYPGHLGGSETPTGSWSLARPCCVGAIAVSVSSTNAPLNSGEMFYPLQNDDFWPGQALANTTMWAVGCSTIVCGGPFVGGIWEAEFPFVQYEPWAPGQTPWSQLPNLFGAVTLTMFTNPDNSSLGTAQDVRQSVWGLDFFGQAFSWQSGQWAHVALPEAGAAWITDGAVLGQSGALYMCFSQPCNAAQDWTYVIAPYTTNGASVSLKQIAMGGVASQAIIGGPPGLIIQSLPPYRPIAWAIDYSGNVYFSQYLSPPGPSQ